MRPRLIEIVNQATGTTIFNWLIPVPSLVYGIAFVVVAVVFIKRCQLFDLDKKLSIQSALICGIAAFIGAKMFFVLVNLKSYILQPSHIFAPGGTISWGVYLFIPVALLLFMKIKKQSALPYLDTLASCLALGPFIGRWSCFLNGDDYGTITNVSWAVQYPTGSYPFASHAHGGIISYLETLSAPVHPNQLYLSANALVLFFVMSWFWRRYQQYVGLTFIVYGMAYSFLRFFLEFFRDEKSTKLIPFLNFSQLMCIVMLLMSISLLIYFYPKLFKHHLIHNNSQEKGG